MNLAFHRMEMILEERYKVNIVRKMSVICIICISKKYWKTCAKNTLPIKKTEHANIWTVFNLNINRCHKLIKPKNIGTGSIAE